MCWLFKSAFGKVKIKNIFDSVTDLIIFFITLRSSFFPVVEGWYVAIANDLGLSELNTFLKKLAVLIFFIL